MPDALEGGCLCGAVRYRIAARPVSVGICHCATCRRAAGAPSVAWATVPRAAFAWSGAPASFASSPGIERTHCPTCGTSLTYREGRDTIDVTVASLDDPEAVAPDREIWLSHRIAWEAVDPGRRGSPEGTG